jgi:hypothetical protein
MPDQPPPRRHFQFRLRTLLIVVTLFCVAGGYVAHQAMIVRERKTLLTRLNTNLGGASIGVGAYRIIRSGWKEALSDDQLPTISWLRNWLGDEAIVVMFIPEQTQKTEAARIDGAFPEAIIAHSWTEWGKLKLLPP